MPTIELTAEDAQILQRMCERVRDEELAHLRSAGKDYTVPGASLSLDTAWKILSQIQDQGYAND